MTAPHPHQQTTSPSTARPGTGRHAGSQGSGDQGTGGQDAARAVELAGRFAEVYGHAPDGVWR
ncbi:hypothetical protein, partial [Kocuria turfanensis]|uniref:hypothetical protein n=1 Tax=Kocuria turfanensis TaxID=388357 RepID=UPI001C99BD1D